MDTKSLELVKVNENDIALMADDDALKLWRSLNVRKSNGGGGNYIRVNNSTLSDDGKPNPSFGMVQAHKWNAEKGEEDVENVVIGDELLYLTSTYSAVSSEWEEKKPLFYTHEHFDGEDIVLYNREGEVVFRGRYKDAKDQYGLKYVLNIYVFYKGDVYVWKLKGSGLTAWFGFTERQMVDVPTNFVLADMKLMKNGTVNYWQPEFKNGTVADVKTALKLQLTLERELFARRNEEIAKSRGAEIKGKGATVAEAEVIFQAKPEGNGETDSGLPF